MAAQMFDEGPFSFVGSSINPALLDDRDRVTVDGGIEAVVVPSGLLSELGEPGLLERP